MLPITPQAPQALTPDHPFRLNTGRIRDQWHSMTRTAKSPRLSQHLAEPFLELHPADAARLGVQPADLVQVTNGQGRSILRALITDAAAEGQVFAPMHWTDENSAAARACVLVPGIVDPISGQPEAKSAPVAVARYDAKWYGFAVAAGKISPQADYWARARIAGGWRVELAGLEAPQDWEGYARAMFKLPGASAATVIDRARGLVRIAFHDGDRLLAALYAGPEPVALARDHIAARISTPTPGHALAGRPAANTPDPGPTVCVCLNVGLNTIREAIESGRALTVTALGDALGAGTSCGSCRPELSQLVTRFRMPEAAE